MIRAPVSATSSGVCDLTLACVPTGMKTGVSISARGVRRSAVRASPSRAVSAKLKPGVTRGRGGFTVRLWA
jgi:hypothetical protein